eukprot:2686287-Alexandrium_andersonii.AAC.1
MCIRDRRTSPPWYLRLSVVSSPISICPRQLFSRCTHSSGWKGSTPWTPDEFPQGVSRYHPLFASPP